MMGSGHRATAVGLVGLGVALSLLAPGNLAGAEEAGFRIHANEDLAAVRASYVHDYYERFGFGVDYGSKTDEEMRQLTGLTYSTTACTTGTLSESWRRDEVGALNWFRQFAGLPPVVEDEAGSLVAQRQALTLTAANTLTHVRTPAMPCFSSPTWAAGAMAENVGTGGARKGHGMPSSYIFDVGVHNESIVGHRQTQLADQATRIAFGRTFSYGVDFMDDLGYSGIWPTAGHFPAEELPHVWSSPDLNSVSVSRDGQPKAVTILNNIAGDGVTTWRVADDRPRQDEIFTYHVSGTKPSGEPVSWDVKVFNALYVPVASIALDPTEVTIRAGEAYPLAATALPASHLKRRWTWSSSNERIAYVLPTVSDSGRTEVWASRPGTATITAAVEGSTARAQVQVRVVDATPPATVPPRTTPAASPVTRIRIATAVQRLRVGRTTQVRLRYWPRRAKRPKVVFRSSDPAVARVNRSGRVTARHRGRARITAQIPHTSIRAVVLLKVVPRR